MFFSLPVIVMVLENCCWDCCRVYCFHLSHYCDRFSRSLLGLLKSSGLCLLVGYVVVDGLGCVVEGRHVDIVGFVGGRLVRRVGWLFVVLFGYLRLFRYPFGVMVFRVLGCCF